MKIVIGLDLGETTGLTALKVENKVPVEASFQEISVPPEQRDEYFVFRLAKSIEKIVGKLDPELVVIEGYWFNQRFFNVMQPEIHAQVKRYMADRSIPFLEANIISMKSQLLANGRAGKSDVRDYVIREMGAHHIELARNRAWHVYDATLPALLGWRYLEGLLKAADIKVIKESIIGG